MRRLMIFGLVVVAVIAIGADMLRPRPAAIELSAATAAMPSLVELHAAARANEIPMLEMEDQALLYPTVEKR
jgi:hypothetical protein